MILTLLLNASSIDMDDININFVEYNLNKKKHNIDRV